MPFGNLFALHMVETGLRSDMTVSASVEADLGADGTPQIARGTVLAEGGAIGFMGHTDSSIPIGAAEARARLGHHARHAACAVQDQFRLDPRHAARRICRARHKPAAAGRSRSAAA